MPTYAFKVHRTGNLAVPCSVPWALEGVGSNPIPGSAFPGGVLPSGTASFPPDVVLAEPSFELLEGERPDLSQTGRLILSNPTGCKLDPQADRHAITLVGDDGPPPPPPDLYEPIKLADLPSSRRTNVTTLGTRTGSAGENFVLTSDVSGSTLTLGGPGSLGKEIVFRGDTDSSAATGLRTLTNCTINLNGDFCGLARLVLNNCRVLINNKSCFVTRCEFTNCSESNRDNAIIDVDSGSKASGFSCHKNDFTDRLGANRSVIIFQTRGEGITFAYNLVEKAGKPSWSDTYFMFFIGSGEVTTNIQSFFNAHHNLIVDCDFLDLIESKISDLNFDDNTIERCGGAGVRIRHGKRVKVRRNLWLEAGNGPLITVRTGPHEIAENQFVTGSGAAGGGEIHLFAGKLHWDYDEWIKEWVKKAGNNWMASGHCTVLANLAQIKNGVESGGSNTPDDVAHGYFADGNNLGPTSGASRNRAVSETAYVVRTERKAVAGYDIDRKLARMTRGAVGLRTS